MSNEILYILLPDFASHEMAYLMEAISSDEQQLKPNPKYVNKIVAPTLDAVAAIGGFRVEPDYSFDTSPNPHRRLRVDDTRSRRRRSYCKRSLG